MVIVQLLKGEIPERSLFGQKGLRVALAPYLALTQARRPAPRHSVWHDTGLWPTK